MIWEAILKPIAVLPTSGHECRIRVQANNREEAAKEVRFQAEFECRNYAITSLKELENDRA